MKVVKRDGQIVDFQPEKIKKAIHDCFSKVMTCHAPSEVWNLVVGELTQQEYDEQSKFRELQELYRSVKIDEIEKKGWTLTPSKYIEFIDHDLDIDFDKEMKRIQNEMSEIISREEKSQIILKEAFEEIGYGIKKD